MRDRYHSLMMCKKRLGMKAIRYRSMLSQVELKWDNMAYFID